MAFIDVIDYPEAEGELKEIYDGLIKSRGKLANVHKIQSLNPKSIVNHMDLYMTIMFGKSPLKRVQREMMAVVVSKANNCEYCQLHHAEAVKHYWKDDQMVEQLKNDYTKLNISDVDRTLCNMAWALTKSPQNSNKVYIDKLRKLGLDDRAILDANMVISYFNFVNRMVIGLGLAVNQDEIAGYSYE